MAGEQFTDLADFWSEGLSLPIRGKIYVVPEPSAKDGLLLQSIFSAGIALAQADREAEQEAPTDAIANMNRLAAEIDDPVQLHRMCLGSAYDAMIADGLGWSVIRHAAQTALFWICVGEAAAREYWEKRANPTPPATNRETRRRATKATPSSKSRATAAGKSTRKAGTPSTTRSRQT